MKNKIYGIKCEGFIKIGYSSSVEKRIYDMQIGNPFDLKVEFLIEPEKATARKIEMLCHQELKSKGRHVKGEWFNFAGDEEAVIRNIINSYKKPKIASDEDKRDWNEFFSVYFDLCEVLGRGKAHKLLGVHHATINGWARSMSVKKEALTNIRKIREEYCNG
ncbi:MAG: GIY-YIG nuclease family protein [Glaciecola sp.]